MGNDQLAVFLYRSDTSDEFPLRGETRDVNQWYPSTIIGVATRPVGEPIESTQWGRDEFEGNVEDVATDVRWFDDELECDTDD